MQKWWGNLTKFMAAKLTTTMSLRAVQGPAGTDPPVAADRTLPAVD